MSGRRMTPHAWPYRGFRRSGSPPEEKGSEPFTQEEPSQQATHDGLHKEVEGANLWGQYSNPLFRR